MYNIIKTYISKAGTYTFSTDDNVLINCPDVILKDCTIKGDLIVGDGVGNGDITLDNTKIEGRLLARGGGQNTISIKNNSTVGNVIISKTGSGDIRIKTEDGAQVEYVYIDDGKDDVILEGTFGQITIETDTPVKIRNARVSLVSVKAAGANISVEGKSLITTIDVDKAAPDCTIIVADVSIISEILINNPQAKVIGWEKADANTNSSGSQPPAGVEDHIAPAYISCEVTGEKTLRIDFSEPVCDGTGSTSINTANFIVDQLKPEYDQISAAVSFSTDYSYTIQSAVISGSSITLTLQETLAEGKVKLTINALGTETSDPIQDFAGNKVSTQDVTFNNTNDGSIISEATVKTAQYNSVTLGFSKPVTAKNIALFHGDKTVLANRSTPVSISDGDFVDEITFAFPSEIPAGPTSLFLVNSSEPDEKMFNIYGEYVPDQELAAVVTPDNEAPFVTDTELVNNNTFRIYFNERVSRSFAVDPANYDFNSYDMIKNNRYYTTVSIEPELSDDGKSVILYLPKGLRDNTKYNISVKNAEDIHGNRITSDIQLEFTNGEHSAPSVEVSKCRTNNNDGKIIIYFSEPMNESQMLDKSSYKVAATHGAYYSSLGTADTVTKLSDRSVLIDMSTAVNSPDVMIAPIVDLSGKSLYNSTEIFRLEEINEETLLVESADLITKNMVKITFSGILESFDVNDFQFPDSDISAIGFAMINNEDDKTEVVIVLNKELTTDVKYNGSVVSAVTKEDCSSISALGTKLSPSPTITINDKVPPEIITYDHDSDPLTDPVEKVILSGNILTVMVDGKVSKNTTGTITITFSEDIHYYSFSVLTFSVEGYTVTSVSNAVNKNEIVLGIKAKSDNTPAKTTVRQEYTIIDLRGNPFLYDKVMQVR